MWLTRWLQHARCTGSYIDTTHITQLTCILLYTILLGTWEKVISLLKHIVTIIAGLHDHLNLITLYKKYNEKLTLLHFATTSYIIWNNYMYRLLTKLYASLQAVDPHFIALLMAVLKHNIYYIVSPYRLYLQYS